MWYRHTKKPISLINFLHAPQKGPSLSSVNSISPLKTNFHLLIDVATQWTDRHFIDLSLTTAAWASGRNRNKKRNGSLHCGRIGLFFLLKSSNLCDPAQFLPSARICSLFKLNLFIYLFCALSFLWTHTDTSEVVHSFSFTHTHTPNTHLIIAANRYDGTLWGDAQ